MDALSKAIQIIKEFEGCKLKAYQDLRGIWTIGWGTTAPILYSFTDWSTYVFPAVGVIWTQVEADRALEEAVEHVMSGVLKVIEHCPIHIPDTALAALVSFVYNVGIGNFERSGVLKCLLRGDMVGASQNLLLWNKIGPYVSLGLSSRRKIESDLLLAAPTNIAL